MNITVKDFELLVNDSNKAVYNTMYDLILGQIENAILFTDVASLTEEKKKAMGTCGIYLSSLVELLNTLRDLMDKGYIESAGSIATACWERAVTLRKIMINPIVNAQTHTYHEKAKNMPWNVKSMIRDILENEVRINDSPDQHPFAEKSFYMQYTLLSSIKHGNPYTISYLNRPGYSSDQKLFKFKSNDSFEDKDLKIYIKMLVIDNALDALIDYSKEFRTKYNFLLDLRKQFNDLISSVELQVPSIMLTTPEEMTQEYWDYLIELDKHRRF